MSHEWELKDQDVEELAEELWTLREEGRQTVDALRATTRVRGFDLALGQLQRRGLARIDGDHIELTSTGRALAERQVRRHRLAEVLFTAVLEVRDDAAVNRTACVIEHVLDPAITESVCAFLGHPPHCPHGKPIPPGSCCRSFSQPQGPLVQPLSSLAPGRSGRVVHIVPRDAQRLVRLSSLGVVPGATIVLQQKSPAVVLRLGATTLAVEPEIAGEIYVRPVHDAASPTS